MQEPVLDCLVIGGGAAGLTAATYLARFRRRIRLVDARNSRLLSIPTSHNYPGFVYGIHGHDILERLRQQAEHYGVDEVIGTVERLEKNNEGEFIACVGERQWRARNVILATGVVDIAPEFPGLWEAVAKGCVRYCPICDGFEAINKKVAIIGRGKSGFAEAFFVRHFAVDVSLFALDGALQLTAEERAKMDRAGIRDLARPVKQLSFEQNTMAIGLQDGWREAFDVVYLSLGTRANSKLAQDIGAACTENGEVTVDPHQQTSVEGLYAVGDVVLGLNQIAVAMGHAAIAATAVHNRLRQTEW